MRIAHGDAKCGITTATLVLALIVISLARPANGQDQQLVAIRVAQFEFHGSGLTGSRGHIVVSGPGGMEEAVGALVQHAEVRVCVEALPPPPRDDMHPIEINVQDKTVGEILEQMIQQDRRYRYRERLGVIEVLPEGADRDSNSCLNKVVPELRIHYPWWLAWGQIRCAVAQLTRHSETFVADPFETGCTGFSHLVYTAPEVLRRTFHRMPLRDILDQLVAMAGNMAWTAGFKAVPRTCDNLELGEVQPRWWHSADPDSLDQSKWAAGLPQKCQSCHYHEPTQAGLRPKYAPR